MKNFLQRVLFLTVFLSAPFALSADAVINKKNCSLKGVKLYGKIKVVESFPDFKVQVVSAFPDLKVKTVSSFPDECGEWQMVESFPDFKVQFVEAFPDFKIEYVEAFPGMP